jgi:hypothetical protein
LTVPGGTLGLYGVEAFAWEQGGSAFAVGIPRLADVRNTDDTLDISMVGVTP